MGKIIFSVVITVLNEAENVQALLDSLVNQSVVPGEIIIVDGGSTDGTIDLVKRSARDAKVPIRSLFKPGLNRSQARNEGIKQAKYSYIAITDAGCVAERDWLLHLRQGFVSQTEAVGGFYLPSIETSIQKVFSRFTCVAAKDFNSITFLPSSRSLAFTKHIWEEVGGYPENLETCEDLVYAKHLFDSGRMISTTKAIVYWRQPKGFLSYYKQIVGYARGDVEANYLPHMVKIVSVWVRYLVFLMFPILFIGYAGYVLIKFRVYLSGLVEAFGILPTQVVTDLGIMTGSLWGVMRRLKR